MDIRFMAKLREAGPTQYEQGQLLCTAIQEACDTCTANGTRYEEALSALSAVFFGVCKEAGYDPYGVSEALLALMSK